MIKTTRLPVSGTWPVMLTPLKDDGSIDIEGLYSLIDFYIGSHVDGLFASCTSSELQFLNEDEVLLLCDEVVRYCAGRVPVVAAASCSRSLTEYAELIHRVAAAGVDAVVVITSDLVEQHQDEALWRIRMQELMDLTKGIRLGVYESPYPYHRILSPETFEWVVKTGRFVFYKDTSCDFESIRKKVAVCKGTQLAFFNAHLETLVPSLKFGANGYSGVSTNFFPELCAWLCRNYDSSEIAEEVYDFLKTSEGLFTGFYPMSAKLFLQMRGVEIGSRCRHHRRQHTQADLEGIQSLYKASQHYLEMIKSASRMRTEHA